MDSVEMEFNEARNAIYIPRKELTLEDRVSIIRDSEKSFRTAVIARKYNCSHDQVRSIIRRKEDHLALWAESPNKGVIKRLRNPLLILTGSILYEWLKRARAYQNVTDDDLRKTGQAIANHIKYEAFRPKSRWLHRFKNKYKLHSEASRSYFKEKGRKLMSLDIGDIIEDMRKEDPLSVKDLDLALNRAADSGKTEDIKMDDPPETRVVPKLLIKLLPKQEDGSNSTASNDSGVKWYELKTKERRTYGSYREAAKEIKNYQEALQCLQSIEQFVLLKENIRAVGLLNQLENIFHDEIQKV